MHIRRVGVAVTACLSAALLLAACGGGGQAGASGGSGGGSTSGADSGPIKIGVALSLTGQFAFAGQPLQDGLNVAVSQVNSQNLIPGHKLSLDVLDDASTPSQGAADAVKLAGDSSVKVMLATDVSTVYASETPVAARDKIPYLILNDFTTGIAKASPFLYQMTPPPASANDKEIDAAVQACGCKTAAIVAATDSPTTADFEKGFAAELKKDGVTVVADLGVSVKATNFSPQIETLRAKKPDLLVTDVAGPTNASLVVQTKRAGLTFKAIVGHPGDITPDYITTGGSSVVGTYHDTYFTPQETTPTAKAFVSLYQAAHNGQAPSMYQGEAYQAVMLLVQALKDRPNDATSRAGIQSALQGLLGKTFPLVVGKTGQGSLSSDRVLTYSLVIVKLDSNGNFIPVSD